MNKQIWGYIKQALIILLLFVSSVYFSFLYDDDFRRMIRFLYTYLSNDRIEVKNPKKYIHFAKGSVVLTFAFYTVLLYTFLQKEKLKKIFLFSSITLVIFFMSVFITCYIEGLLLLAESTTYLGGKRVISFSEIPYDRIFIQSIIIAALPIIVTMTKASLRSRKGSVV
jgi:hypothetical protein